MYFTKSAMKEHRDNAVWKLWKRMARVTSKLTGAAWQEMWERWNATILRKYGPPQ